jgi:hypothetical protein
LNTRTKVSVGTIAAAVSIAAVAATASANVGVAGKAMNGVKHAVRADGSLKPNAVGHTQLRNGIISCEKLTRDLTNALCKGALAKTGTASQNGARGANGQNGQNGADGKDGKPGADGVSGYEVRTFDYIRGGARPGHPGVDSTYGGAGNSSIATVACSPGKVAVGGGYWIRNGQSEVVNAAPAAGQGATASFPGRMDWSTNTPLPNRNDGWIVYFNGNGPASMDVTLYAICVNAA